MIFLVTGGAASGKSEYAEKLACRLSAIDGGTLIYLATMQPAGDPETAARIRRHQALRAGKGFRALERCRDLSGVQVPGQSVVLLECLMNLAANEMFAPDGDSDLAFDRICAGLAHLAEQSRHLIVVSGDLFSDGAVYSPETEAYRRLLARLHTWLAARAEIREIVCGLVGAPPQTPQGASAAP